MAENKAEEKKNKPKSSTNKSVKAKKPVRKHKRADDQFIKDMDDMLMKEHAVVKEANAEAMGDNEPPKGLSKIKTTVKEYVFATIAVIIGSIGTVSVMNANGLTVGGVTGIVRILQKYTDCNFSLTYYAFCMAILLLVWLTFGLKEVKKILFMSLAYPVVMFLLETENVVLLKSDDLLLVSLFCGVLFGICNAFTFKAGFSSGGSDSFAKVIKYKFLPHLGINDITFAINAAVVAAGAVVFGLRIGLYAVVITYTSMKVGEAVMYGLSNKIVELEVITDKPKELADFVITELGRGVSGMEVVGEYTGVKRKDLKILCTPRESFLIKRYLVHHDPHSFVTVSTVNSVWGAGRGFSDIHKIDD